MKQFFTNGDSSRGISILVCLLYWILFVFLLVLTGSFISPLFPARAERFVYGIFGTCAIFGATWLFLKLENRSFSDYGLSFQKSTVPGFLKGVILGVLIFIAIILILLSFTELQIGLNPKSWSPWTAFWYLSIVPLALMEEVAFRSYSYLKLNKALGLRITQVIVAAAFAGYHIAQGWNIQVALLGPGMWAFAFGLAAVWSNGIALPTGLHFSLNLIQQVLGMKGGDESLWTLKYDDGASAEAMSHGDAVGLATQILVFAGAIVLTELYIRNKQERIP